MKKEQMYSNYNQMVLYFKYLLINQQEYKKDTNHKHHIKHLFQMLLQYQE